VEDVEHQPIGALDALGVFDIADSERIAYAFDAQHGVMLVCNHADYEAEGNLEAFQFERPNTEYPVVQVVHTMLMPHKSGGFPGVPWLRWEDFETPADVVLIGHPHTPYPPQEINGRVFVAPGSMGRENKTLTHTPQIACVWLTKDECCVQYVPIAAAKPYDEVFQKAGVELEKALDDLQVKSFVEQYLAGAELTERLTFEGLTQAIREMDMQEAVKERALQYLGAAHGDTA
jgi:predicted phosphodiesterase